VGGTHRTSLADPALSRRAVLAYAAVTSKVAVSAAAVSVWRKVLVMQATLSQGRGRDISAHTEIRPVGPQDARRLPLWSTPVRLLP
jgi:hypothetical protein